MAKPSFIFANGPDSDGWTIYESAPDRESDRKVMLFNLRASNPEYGFTIASNASAEDIAAGIARYPISGPVASLH